MKVKIKEVSSLKEQVYQEDKKRWFVTRLIEKAKELPVQEMPMTGLNTYSLYPQPKSMNSFVSHVQKVNDADLSKPIILDDEGYVMDGRHRIAKALLDGVETIKFVRFEETPIHDYMVD
jgi:hypothetical protein